MRIATILLIGGFAVFTGCDSEEVVKVPSHAARMLEPATTPEKEQPEARSEIPKTTWAVSVDGVEIERSTFERLAREASWKSDRDRKRVRATVLNRMVDRELLRQHAISELHVDPRTLQVEIDRRTRIFGGQEALSTYLQASGTDKRDWIAEVKLDLALAALDSPKQTFEPAKVYENLTGQSATRMRYRVSNIVLRDREAALKAQGKPLKHLESLDSGELVQRTSPGWVAEQDLAPDARAAIQSAAVGTLTAPIESPRGPALFAVHDAEEETPDIEGLEVANDLAESLGRSAARDALLRELRQSATIEVSDDFEDLLEESK